MIDSSQKRQILAVLSNQVPQQYASTAMVSYRHGSNFIQAEKEAALAAEQAELDFKKLKLEKAQEWVYVVLSQFEELKDVPADRLDDLAGRISQKLIDNFTKDKDRSVVLSA